MPHRQRVTIRDVAAAAGVSQTTVSHVMNGKGRIEATTRERVLQAAARLRYRPNAMARGTRSGVSHLLGLVVPSDRRVDALARTAAESYAQVALAASAAAQARGFSIVLVPADLPHPELGHLLCDGVIEVDPRPGDPLLGALRSWEIPTAIINRPPPEFDDGWWIGVDTEAATTLVLQHLADAGARRTALVVAESGRAGVDEVGRTYDAWTRDRGAAPASLVLVGADGLPRASAVEELRRLLAGGDPVDGVATVGHGTDALVLRIARDEGLRVPRDLLVASLNESGVGRLSRPSVTALDSSAAAAATAAVDLLLGRLGGDDPPSRPPRVTATLIERESTARRVASGGIPVSRPAP